ncbi:MAG TPA: PKD domain-containing protein [Candidatus Thermoplasmatota archaeon]|nr:PKD domain-containing protein [Candidatus Thermoplasmatota archaeon]
MLQKILVVVLGLVMSVVGALSPAGLFASNDGSGSHAFGADTAEQTLTTLRTGDGQAFARVSVLWVEVDGRRVTEDAWGTGQVDEIKFKIGVKDVDGVALAVGDRTVELHPTDIITVRMFHGDFSYRGVGTALASVQLQGQVKTTVLKEGDIRNKVLTTPGDLDLGGVKQADTKPGDESKVAYVVLTTGEKVDTVAVEDGGARIFTEEAVTASDAKSEPGNLLATWVKIDNKLVREYTWGDGSIKKIEFQPADAVSRSVVLEFNGEVAEIAGGERVVIEDFVGEYLIYQVSGGMMRVRLDGYAASFTTGSALAIPQLGGPGAPLVNFDFQPVSPKTTDTVQFTDLSEDDGGIVVFRQWDFGDGSSSVALETPTHRFARPGSYEVTLSATDNDLQTSNLTRTIVVRNADPVSDFDFSPKVVTTETMVAFTDQSFDPDGTLTNWSWDFGDGSSSFSRHPSHRFTRGQNVTVTLTTTDELGARSALSKVVIVRNSPPLAGFSFSTVNGTAPQTLDAIQFLDNSTDTDGVIALWNWSFGDGSFGSGSAPIHAYARPGVFTVSLSVTDDGGDTDTVSTNIMVSNREPFADFTWTPNGEPANVPVTFASTSVDVDGLILSSLWEFGDGTASSRGGVVSHTFPRAGTFNVKLTTTDNNLGQSNITKSVTVANSAPRANFGANPTPAFRGAEVTFSDSSIDPDGDALVNWTWDLGDGDVKFGKVIHHVYTGVGTKSVTLTVTDSGGTPASVTRFIRILNRPPTASLEFAPRPPVAGDDVVFTAQGIDPDVPTAPLTFEWSFSDGVQLTGQIVNRTFLIPGNYSVVLHSRDQDGGLSQPVIRGVTVLRAQPKVNFSFEPIVPVKGEAVHFHDLSIPAPSAPIDRWQWDFGTIPAASSADPNPSFVFPSNGTFFVSLKVWDVFNESSSLTKQVFVNLRPIARFEAPVDPVKLNEEQQFRDLSVDDDGVIVAWLWDFGEGNTSTVMHPTKTYDRPGAYTTTLTVWDDHNTTGVATKTVAVQDRLPTAAWTYHTDNQPAVRNTPFFFNGSTSSDPDGQPIVNYTWTFGDRFNAAPGTGVAPTHTFSHSGVYPVGLVVDSGGKPSPKTTQSIRVGANHPISVRLNATLPGDRPADLTIGGVSLSLKVNGQIDVPDLVPDGFDVIATIAPELWIDTDVLRITLNYPGASNLVVVTRDLDDGVPSIIVPIEIGMPVRATVIPAPGERAPFLPLLFPNENYTAGGDPLYRDMQERPHGTGTAQFADGTLVAMGSRVEIEARYVPLIVLENTRNAAPSNAQSNTLLGWCVVDLTTTDPDGTFAWEFDGASPCVANAIAGGVYPIGRWEVRAWVSPIGAVTAQSPVKVFYVDPTGGQALAALSGLA